MSGIKFSAAEHVLIRLTDDEGLVGWGEASTSATWAGDYGHNYGEVALADKYIFDVHLRPALIERCFESASDLHAAMSKQVRGYPYLASAVDMAWHDLAAKRAGLPLCAYLSAQEPNWIPVVQSIGFKSRRDTLLEFESGLEEGARNFKLKVGRDGAGDIAMIEDLVRRLPVDARLGLDGNRGYPLSRATADLLHGFADLGVAYIEQPVEGLEAMADLQSVTSVPLVLDESVWSPMDLEAARSAEAGRGAAIYIGKAGGVSVALEMAYRCQAVDWLYSVNGSGELGIANAANLHVASAAGIPSLGAVVPVTAPEGVEPTHYVGRQYIDDIVTEPFAWDEGSVLTPGGDGLGVSVDLEKLERYCVDAELTRR